MAAAAGVLDLIQMDAELADQAAAEMVLNIKVLMVQLLAQPILAVVLAVDQIVQEQLVKMVVQAL
jgi:L-fucose mutarotase/ribose pyranase (RbsD/FucU family)